MYVLIGAGGHAKVIIDILRLNNKSILGVIDDFSHEDDICGVSIIGKTEDIEKLLVKYQDTELKFIISIGSNEIRARIEKELGSLNMKYGTAIHPTAVIGSNVDIGEGTVIMANAVVNNSTIIGKHTIINTGATVDHDCRIGDFVHISPGTNLAGNVCVGKLTQIGIGSSIIQGKKVGSNTMVGAGAVVIENIGDNVVAVGCPAKIIKIRWD